MMLSKPPPPTPHPVDDMVSSSTTSSTRPLPSPQLVVDERRARPQKEHALNCPRCNSNNTKFCYYNNYSLTQPRYFCKTCRRYWTEGGSLRNVPVGGGSRKNKRSSASSSSSSSSSVAAAAALMTNNANSFATSSLLEAPPKKVASDHLMPTAAISPPTSTSTHNPKFHEGRDLNLGFPHPNPYLDGEFRSPHSMNASSANNGNLSTCSSSSSPAMELLSGNGVSSRGFVMNPFLPLMPTVHDCSAASYPPGGFGLQELRSAATLNFPVGGVGGLNAYGQNSMREAQEGGGRAPFPFEDLRQQVPSNPTPQLEQNKGQGGDSCAGFWNGVMGGGSSW